MKIILQILFVIVSTTLFADNYVIFNQIMYDSPLNEKVTEPPYSNGEFIELYNGGTDSVNLKNWLIKGDGTTEVYIFDSLILAPCAFLILAYRHNNSQDFQINDLYHNLPPTANYQIVYQNKIVLSNSGEHLILKNSLNQTVDSIYYDGTSHKTSPYRIYAENEDSINAIYCRSLHRTNIEFDQQGLALPHYSQWQTTNITFAQLALAENYFYENKFLGTDASLPMNENYIVSITPLDATARISNNNNQPSASSTIRTITDIQYYDGIGRPDQNILLNITPDKHDLVSLQEYSGISRNTINYLPLPTTSNGQPAHYETISNQLQDYYSDQRPFTETFYENSHLKRIIGQTKAGETYQNHPTNNSYEFNTSADNVRKFDIICTSQNKYLKCQNNYYPENTLYKNTITDEDGVAVTTFSDKLGRKILERRNGNDTYFVYDDKGFLYCVLPNLDNSQAFSELTDIKNDDYLKHNAYIYDYTPNGNLIYKHLPSIEPQLMVYDKTRHLIMSQTANQRQNNKWSFYSHDSLGRNILSAEIHTQLSHQQLIEKYDTIWQVGRNINYTNPQILCQKYYDNYDFLNNLNTQTKNKLKYEQLQNYDIQHDNASGLLTGTKIYSLEENKFVYTTLYYDYKGKVIQQRQTTFDNSYRVIYFSYNFDGTVSKQLICKFSENDNCIVEHYAYCYDHAGKLTHTYYKLNEEPEILHSHKLYNELGLLTKNIRHNNTDTIEYRYDMRGLLTHTLSNASSEQLFYADSLDIGITPCYNGNISASYKTHADTIYKFSYLYDNQNRLTESNRLMPTSEQQLSEGFAYSNNGSITNLQRYADTLLVDNLSFSYTSGYNKLIAITDAGDDANFYNLKEYHDTHLSTNEEPDFGYDSNGNLIFDKDRVISHITYNLYNQPDTIQFTNGNQIVNLYDATGQKYKTIFFSITATIISPDQQIQHYSFDSDTINYVVKQYDNNIETTYNSSNKFLITRIFNDEGYFENHAFKGIGNPPQVLDNNCFYYYHTDHLDNICAVYNATKNQVQQRTLYYASGLPMAESTNASKQPYKYNGKEFVGMFGLDEYDISARHYYPAIMRTTTPDPLAEQYYHLSPYSWCGNNLINNIDTDGKKYKVITQKDKKIVKAKIYTNKKSYNSAKKAADFWNKQKDKTYTSKDGITYKVEFQIEIEITNNPEKNALKDEIGNSYEIGEVPDKNKRKDVQQNGITYGNKYSIIIPEKADGQTGAHEIGHQLSAEHDSSGIMTVDANNSNRSDEVTQNNIDCIIESYIPPKQPEKTKLEEFISNILGK